MDFQLLEVNNVGLAYIILGGFVVAFSMCSFLMKQKWYINEVVLGTVFGILVGPYVADVFDPRSWSTEVNAITLEVTRVVLATGLFTIGAELPKRYMVENIKALVIMVVPTMALGWVIVAGFIHLLFPRLSFISSLAIAACLTPTDPIICAAIVGGRYAIDNVPEKLRHLLSAESAANDGMAFPFLTISLFLILDPTPGQAVSHWILVGCLYQVIMGVIIGAILGLIFSFIMKTSQRRGFINKESYVAQYLVFAIFTIGIVSTIGSDDLLAAFAAGCTISYDGEFNLHTKGDVFPTVVDFILNCGCFVYIGAWLPFASFDMPSLGITPWRLIILLITIIAFRRIPALLILYKWIPGIDTWGEALFSGHYGPMGVGAVFISSLAMHMLQNPSSAHSNEQEMLVTCLQPIVAFIVLGSIIIHGLSIPLVSLGTKFFSPSGNTKGGNVLPLSKMGRSESTLQ